MSALSRETQLQAKVNSKPRGNLWGAKRTTQQLVGTLEAAGPQLLLSLGHVPITGVQTFSNLNWQVLKSRAQTSQDIPERTRQDGLQNMSDMGWKLGSLDEHGVERQSFIPIQYKATRHLKRQPHDQTVDRKRQKTQSHTWPELQSSKNSQKTLQNNDYFVQRKWNIKEVNKKAEHLTTEMITKNQVKF